MLSGWYFQFSFYFFIGLTNRACGCSAMYSKANRRCRTKIRLRTCISYQVRFLFPVSTDFYVCLLLLILDALPCYLFTTSFLLFCFLNIAPNEIHVWKSLRIPGSKRIETTFGLGMKYRLYIHTCSCVLPSDFAPKSVAFYALAEFDVINNKLLEFMTFNLIT